MKIITNNLKYKTKLIELQILKSKIYKTFTEKKMEISKVKLYLTKVSHIINEYHIKNKKILFINFPSSLNLINKNNKHIFMSKENWVNNFLSNKSVDSYYQNELPKLSSSKQKPFDIKKSFDLIVLFDPTNNNLLYEKYNSDVPIIIITDEIFITKASLKNYSYKVFGYFKFIEEQVNNNLFFSILRSILNQPVIIKHYKQSNITLLKKRKRKYKFKPRYNTTYTKY